MESTNLNQHSFQSEEKVFNSSFDSCPSTPKSTPQPIHMIYFDQATSKSLHTPSFIPTNPF